MAQANSNIIKDGASITSLAPSPQKKANAEAIQTASYIASAVGSGVPLSVATAMQNTPTPAADTPSTTNSGDDNTLYYYIGGAAVLVWLMGNKKRRTYVRRATRRVYAKARAVRSYASAKYRNYRRRK
jgi:hypothetical protein